MKRKYHNLSRIAACILSVVMLVGFCPQGVRFADMQITLSKVNAAENISNPRIVKDSSMDAGQKVTWDCIYFGSYPQSEITAQDSSIYNTLKNATGWDDNNDIMIGGTKYRRLKGEDATYATSGSWNYDWNGSYETYHYFKYEPIKWRVLNRNGNDAFLLADVALDAQKYNVDDEYITWETSSIRSWLNGYEASVNKSEIDYSRKNFINSAFTSIQKNAIKTTSVVNNNNIKYGTTGGNDTSDKVFLLSESEVYNTDAATGYGFIKEDTSDEARTSHCSTYAWAMGIEKVVALDSQAKIKKYNGNIKWWLRSPGIGSDYAAAVSYFDYVDEHGEPVQINCYGGVRPALHLNLTSSNLYSYAGTVCSNGTTSESKPTDSNPSSGNNTGGTNSNKNNTVANTNAGSNITSEKSGKRALLPVEKMTGSLKSVKSPAKNTLAITWKKLSKVTGYHIQFSSKSNFKRGTIERKFKKKDTKTQVRPLKSKKKYYVRMRPYTKLGSKIYYGKWSKVKGVKIK